MKKIALAALASLLSLALTAGASALEKKKSPQVARAYTQEICAGLPAPRTDAKLVTALKQCPKDDDQCLANAIALRDASRDAVLRRTMERETVIQFASVGVAMLQELYKGHRRDLLTRGVPQEKLDELDKAIRDFTAAGSSFARLLTTERQ